MPAPRWLARFNRRVTNRVTGLVAPYLPGFGLIEHVGRRTGRRFRTPVNVFKGVAGSGTADGTDADTYVVALTYGVHSDWVRNVFASGGCELIRRGRRLHVGSPEVVHDEERRLVPMPVRAVLGAMHVDDFLTVRVEPVRKP
jgi:deazaflavin-dependent oxidoreductase (nitroreductase family)